MKPIFFSTRLQFRKWLQANHKKETELYVGYYKVKSGKKGITWSESVDEALCYGWIDGIRNKIDDESYCNRFTPRKPTSSWSAVNIKKAEALIKEGLMKPAGLEAYSKRTEENSEIYSYENKPKTLDAKFEKAFKSNKKAWDFFNAQAPYYKRMIVKWIMSAKQEKTKLTRLQKAVAESAKKEKLFR